MELRRKAFIRSVEAILAIILFVSFFYGLTENYQKILFKQDLSVAARQLLDSIDSSMLAMWAKHYSFSQLSKYADFLFSGGYKFEFRYYEPILVRNSNDFGARFNISFVKFFPNSVNLGSIAVMNSSGDSMPVDVANNYFMTSLSVRNDGDSIYNGTITLNDIRILTDSDSSINESSFVAFFGPKRIDLSVNSITYNHNYYDANISITLLVPFMKTGSISNVYLFYAQGAVDNPVSYPSLGSGRSLYFTQGNIEKSKASEIRFSSFLPSDSETPFTLYYEVNTVSNKSFASLSSNDTNIVVSSNDEFYYGSNSPNSYEYSSSIMVDRMVEFGDRKCDVVMKVWNYE